MWYHWETNHIASRVIAGFLGLQRQWSRFDWNPKLLKMKEKHCGWVHETFITWALLLSSSIERNTPFSLYL